MPSASPRICAVIPAAGVGKRMGSEIPKQYLNLLGKSVLTRTLERLAQVRTLQKIYVAIASDDPYWPEQDNDIRVPVATVEGGEERCHSVLNGLARMSEEFSADDWVLVHDAARPCVRREDIESLLEKASAHAIGGILATPVRDTMKRTTSDQEITETEERDLLWHALTPQMFRIGQLKAAIENALAAGKLVTDEASAMEIQGYQPLVVRGHADNIKITQPEDLQLAGFYLQSQEATKLDATVTGLDDGG